MSSAIGLYGLARRGLGRGTDRFQSVVGGRPLPLTRPNEDSRTVEASTRRYTIPPPSPTPHKETGGRTHRSQEEPVVGGALVSHQARQRATNTGTARRPLLECHHRYVPRNGTPVAGDPWRPEHPCSTVSAYVPMTAISPRQTEPAGRNPYHMSGTVCAQESPTRTGMVHGPLPSAWVPCAPSARRHIQWPPRQHQHLLSVFRAWGEWRPLAARAPSTLHSQTHAHDQDCSC
jgi:hypothetical protein